ncbi:MAG: glycosyltransferase [Thermoguttaceae bacterium]
MIASVVVPTYRRDGSLARCLARLQTQRFNTAEYEIIIADDGPKESTRRLVADWPQGAGPPVRYVPVTATQGPAGARNAGWRVAQGHIIAFTDDDCLPEPDWLAEGVSAIVNHRADAATGRTLVPLPAAPTDAERDIAGLTQAEFVTANCFCRRDALAAIGGFDERFTRAWREDSDLQFTLLERGRRIVRASRAVVIHPLRPLPWGVSLRLQRRGIFDALLRRKHPQLYREHVAPFPRIYFGAASSLAVAAGGLATKLPAIAVAGFAVWLILTARFAARRLHGATLAPAHIAEMLLTSAMIPVLSLYWRLRGAWRYRRVRPEAS